MTSILIDGDFKNIEGRMNAWLAGQEDMLEAFRANDRDPVANPDIYKITYARAFGVPIESVTKRQRQIGKVIFLATGYQGGVGAVLKMGPTYGLKPKNLVAPIREAIGPKLWDKTMSCYDMATDKRGLVPEEWTAVKTLVSNGRKAIPKIVQSWFNLQQCAILAVDNPGQLVIVKDYRNVSYLYKGRFLWCRLPSGRHINYYNPRLEVTQRKTLCVYPTDEEKQAGKGEVYFNLEEVEPAVLHDLLMSDRAEIIEGKARKQVVFDGRLEAGDPRGKWGKKALYGGLQCENIDQGASFDVQRAKMLAIEAAGFPIVMHTHDNITAEVGLWVDGVKQRQIEELTQRFGEIMRAPLPWAPGLPIEVEVHAGQRYAGQ